jgi:DNA-binding response OmpR family regulator
MHKLSGKRVLIVDDEEYVRNLLLDFFSFHSFETVTASNGSEALKTLKEKSCSLVITDLNMPEIDGIELIGKVRSLADPLKIIGMSYEDRKDEFLKAGADYFLSKPFNFHYLKSLLNSIQE